jgi:Oxidation resistance protein
MGITASKSKSSSYDKLRNQLTRIGDQNPFGDDEIMRLSRCMAYLGAFNGRHIQNKNDGLDEEHFTGRWLTDLAIFCSTLAPAEFVTDASTSSNLLYNDLLMLDPNLLKKKPVSDHVLLLDQRKRIKYIMTVIEEHVLPPDFGRTLYERYFALLTPSPPMTEYDQDSPTDAQTKIAWERLVKFINGASETSRRGSRKALTCIFKCCTKDWNSNVADGKVLLDCVYRLSLACAVYSRYMANQDEIIEQKRRLLSFKEKKRANETGQVDSNLGENEVPGSDDETDDDDEVQEIPIFDPSSLFPRPIDDCLVNSLLEHAAKESSIGMGSMAYLDTTEQSNAGNDGNVSLGAFLEWAEASAPCLSSCLETFMHQVLFPDKAYPPSRSEFIFPNLRGQHSAFFGQEASPLLFSFAAMSPSLGGSWHRLYTSDSDGLSFNRLQNALLGYSGPTLLIIKEAEHGGIFGAKTSTAWKESKDFYGNSDCFLFTIKPKMLVMRPRGTGTNYMYCNSMSRSRGYDGLAHGIGFGGNSEKPRLFISETFDGCMAGSSDLTYEAGQMLPSRDDGNPSKFFELEALEVWGVGGDEVVSEALGNRHKQREIVASNIRKARKVDKAQFLDDFKSGLIESKAFRHRAEIRGRGDCHIDEHDEKNYICD